MNKYRMRLEGFGLLFLLLAFFMQCCTEHVDSKMQSEHLKMLHEKLDYIWYSELDEYVNSERSKTGMGSYLDRKFVWDSWVWYDELKKEFSNDNFWYNIVDWGRIILYIIGSALVLMSKLCSNDFLRYVLNKRRRRTD